MNNKTGDSQLWQRNLVLLAKNTFVWLAQLSQKYSREILTLDEIPEEELVELRSLGITGLWMVGIWKRSPASKKIKHLYGHKHLIGSAYSINGYEVSSELGGEPALERLKSKAEKTGIFIACDMVPNHTGVDSDWVIDHPDWYITAAKKPVESWEFNSEDLSPRPGIQIRIEDGYYTRQEAAEAFQLTRSSGDSPLFIYHGNDGTSMPWNDTAQLDYLNPQVREAVKRQILDVASRFPLIRLDAAMTLIRKHFKRLWYPDYGENNCVPTRENFPISRSEFDDRMPREFWAEVMEALKQKFPDTLLVAEAFWLMEKFFVRDLGMHRVYNSAFMNHLRDESNHQIRTYYRQILKEDPTMLEHFVNYLTTPDEAPAAESFGKGEKYFGACGLMSSLPGLPMFGHGQMEGLKERYGMDLRQPMQNGMPDQGFLDAHRFLIGPLLSKRERFTFAQHMAVVDFKVSNSVINENVLAFTVVSNGLRSLIIFNNNVESTKGTISLLSHTESQGESVSNIFLDGLDKSDSAFVTLKELRTNEKKIVEWRDLKENGLRLVLYPYQFNVYDVA